VADIWLHSDWHWEHENIYKFTFVDSSGETRRVRDRFTTVQEGDAFIAQAWADTVKAKDHVWVLGDCTLHRERHRATEFVKLIRSLPGHKRLTPGNHDHYHPQVYVDAGFEKIRGANQHGGVLMSHYPVHPSALFKVLGNVHGHIHRSRVSLSDGSVDPRYYCACVEMTDYKPINFEEVRDYFRYQRALREGSDVGISGSD
jgi:calcineurin-like phosphoesterase family protein